MEEFKKYKFGDIVNILDSKRIPLSATQRENRKGIYPYYGAQGIIDYIDDYIFDGTYLLIAEDGENLKSQKNNIAQIAIGKYWVNNHAHIVESNGSCDIRYICYLLNKIDISGYITGSAQPKLNQANLQSIELSLPSLTVQKRIADYIDLFDSKISLNRRINDNLEQQAQALFKSWFVDFEPFKDGKFVESEMGMIPEGWKVGTIGEYCSIRSGYAFKSSWWQETGTKVIKIKNITDNKTLDMSDCSYVSSDKTYKAIDFQASPGDLIIAMTGATIGKFCIIPFHNDNIYINQRVGKFFLGNNPLDRLPFIYCCLSYEPIYNEIISKGQGSAQPNIGGADIENIRIVLSPSTELKEFNSLLRPIFQKKMQIEYELSKLSVLRDTLLPRLMSGELKINDLNC